MAESTAIPSSRRLREVNYEFSEHFLPILEHLQCSLVVSTYSAGKVLTIGSHSGELQISASNFQHAMGIAVGEDQLAVGGRNLVWFLNDLGKLAPRIEPAGRYDRGYLSRESFVTGDIQIHELAFNQSGELWIVNTLFSCLCTLHENFNFVPRWQPAFISEVAAEDRCHLNGLATVDGQPKYVTALGTTDSHRGWRDSKVSGGVLIDVESGEIVASGFCMPHSPRVSQGQLFLLDSGRGQLKRVDPNSGDTVIVAEYPGYGRGLAILGQFAFVGMSRARETSVFGGVPICEDRDAMRCGIAVVDLQANRCVAYLQFKTGVEELFDVQVIPGARDLLISGPFPVDDDRHPVWLIPNPNETQALLEGATTARVARGTPDVQ